MWLDPLRYEVMDDQMADVLRAKTPDERLKIAHGMWRTARDVVQDVLRSEHPDWAEAQLNDATTRRLLGEPK